MNKLARNRSVNVKRGIDEEAVFDEVLDTFIFD